MSSTIGNLHTKKETAQILRISVATLDRRIADGSIEYYKNGLHVLFDDEQIQNICLKLEIAYVPAERKETHQL